MLRGSVPPSQSESINKYMMMSNNAASDAYPTLHDIRVALRSAHEEALEAVEYDVEEHGGWAAAIRAAGNPKNIDISDEDDLQKTVKGAKRLMDQLRPDETEHDLTLPSQLLHLYNLYFTGRPELWSDCNPAVMVCRLAKMANQINTKGLWPNGSWVKDYHMPHPSWLSKKELDSVLGDIEYAVEYRGMLHQLGYAPVNAPGREALDTIWHDLYTSNNFSATKVAEQAPLSSATGKYAVVSYVQCANGTKPPASWTTEVDSVLDGLVQLGVVPEKLVWFDKLASRQYKDSLKWWGAAATMQFLFNPVIVILPRISEHPSFAPSIGTSIWGSGEAVDCMYTDFLEHAQNCTTCQTSFALRWALEQDRVIPVGCLRTWPRVEHALGASGLGLFTSETTYSALVACLTCAFAMWGALLKNDSFLHQKLVLNATLLPSTYIREDGSMLVAGWVVVSCCHWEYHSYRTVSIASLIDMASTMMELHDLFCQLHTPRLLALGKDLKVANRVLVYETIRLPEAPGLFYPKGHHEVVDVPTLARFNTNHTHIVHVFDNWLDEDQVVGLNRHLALLDMHKNQPQEEIIDSSFVTARKRALSTLVYTKAALAPCYNWSDKLVAAILLSLPNIFAQAVTFWNKPDMLQRLGSIVLSQAEIEDLEETDQEIKWEPNTLILVLGIMYQKHVLHRLVPRPPGFESSIDRHVSFQPFRSEDSQSRQFAALFLGHIPPRSLSSLEFKTTGNTDLPRAKEWVHEILQDGALCYTNVFVIRSLQSERDGQDLTHCWHCARKARCSAQSPSDKDNIVVDFSTLRDFVDDMLSEYGGNQSKACKNLMWGIGSFDPLNLGALFDDDCYFGNQPDTVAVLIERGSRSVKSAAGWTFHAQGLAQFCILGSKAASKCNACHAIIILEKDSDAGNRVITIWTILPIRSYKERLRRIPGFAEII